MNLPALTPDRLRQLVIYDPLTGAFMRLRDGSDIGHKTARGYCALRIDGRTYLAHRLAWLYANGVWPSFGLDHIDGCKTNNRLSNLREADQVANLQNQRRPHADNSTGILGVSWDAKNKRFRASIRYNGRTRNLGRYETSEQARTVYLQAKQQYHVGAVL